jgi:S-adenosylmethionine-diacylgycerolhomoserine-N-methlytransferase
MLATARRKIARARCEQRVTIRFELAEALEWREAEDGTHPEVILFSYSLSMIPEWKRALARAYELLPAGGRLIVLDFWDQHTYPGVLRLAIQKWLALFSVKFKPEHLAALKALRSQGAIVHFTPIGGSYAYRVEVKKRAELHPRGGAS